MEKPTIEERKERIRAAWDLREPDEVPFLIEIGPFHAATARYFGSDREELAWNEAYHRDREAVYDYGLPNLKPNLGIGLMAAAFGCAQTANEEADPWIRPILREENAGDVRRLPLPDPAANPVLLRAYERIAFLQSNSGLPLRLVNVASPLVTASQIWDYTTFVEATLLHPAEVHELLEKVTESTIAFVKAQVARIERLHALSHEMWYLPVEYGIRVSDDTAALMSPALYREFGVRYNNRLSEAFGGIVVHSCGDLSNVFGVMLETRGLRGIDLAIPQNPRWDLIRDGAAGRTALVLRHFYWDHGADATGGGGRVDLVEYSRRLVEYFGRRGVLIQTSAPTAAEAAGLGRRLHEALSR